MSEDKISVAAKQKKPLKNLASLFSGLGFTKITYGKNTLTVEKVKGQDLQGKPYLEYRVEFGPSSIDFTYSFSKERNKLSCLLDLMPTFLNVLQVAEDYYDVQPTGIFVHINTVLAEVSKIIDRDALEFSTQLSELQGRHGDLNAKYEDLVRSSEANTRILLECERNRDELQKKLTAMSGMSDDLPQRLLIQLDQAPRGHHRHPRVLQIAFRGIVEGRRRAQHAHPRRIYQEASRMKRQKSKVVRPAPPAKAPAREYIYSFELSRPFPNVRSFIFKKSLSKSMTDTFMELFGTAKKRQSV